MYDHTKKLVEEILKGYSEPETAEETVEIDASAAEDGEETGAAYQDAAEALLHDLETLREHC